MDEFDARKKKRIEDVDEKAAAQHPAVSRGVASGELKGKPKSREPEPSGRVKPPVSDARKQGAESERDVGRRDLVLPPEVHPGVEAPDGNSLGLRLEVSADRITVLNSLAVDAPTVVPERVRGTDFLAVYLGDEVVALKALIDPGVAYGIPDPEAPEFLGHREVVLDTYELTILLPLEPVERLGDRELEGDDGTSDRRPAALEIVMYRAPETTVIEPGRVVGIRDRDDLEVVASSGELTIEELRAKLWTGRTGRGGAKEPPETDYTAE